jgi:hypothetical protein
VLFRNVFLAATALCGVPVIASIDSGAVHEWGTFTSVAGEDGAAIGWEPLSGPSDLPCFVHHLDQRNLKAAEYGTVRMETPVMYFYPLKPITVSVHVDFPNGRVTEWYPQASSVQPSSRRKGWIEWKGVHLSNIGDSLPKLGGASRYYAARETDAWPLRSQEENEKLLFYRGIGDFGVDIRPVVHTGGVLIHNEGAETIPAAIVFENHAGHMAYHFIRGLREPVNVNFSDLGGTIENLRSEFEDELIEMGLYRKEAHAMLETWHDSWFEDGLRIFYILPRAKVDTLLPISINPSPAQLVRVFVGRVELLSPQMRQEISGALENGEVDVLKKYGRFLNAFLREMSGGPAGPPMDERASQFLQRSYRRALAESWKVSCTE